MKKAALFTLTFALLLAPRLLLAQDYTSQLNQTGVAVYGTPTRDLNQAIGIIINALLGFLGVIFLVLIIYGGFLWMTAGGNKDQVEKARKLLINSFIGLLITVSAYAITQFVIELLPQ